MGVGSWGWESKIFMREPSGFCLRWFENNRNSPKKKVRVTLADFALDALKICTFCVLPPFGLECRFSKNRGFSRGPKVVGQACRGLGFFLSPGLGCLGPRALWCCAYRNWELVFLFILYGAAAGYANRGELRMHFVKGKQ